MNSKLLYILWKSVLSQIIWYSIFVWYVCSFATDEQVSLFARVQKSTCAKVMPTVCIMLGLAEWENELNVSNEMHCIYVFLQRAKSHTPTHTRTNVFVDIWYSIFDMWHD